MEAALSSAELSPREVDHLNAHGTGTVLNDPIEAGAVRRLFPNWPQLPVAAVKSMIGHAIAAAGALEAAACLFSFERNLIPPNVGLETIGPGCELFHVRNTGHPFSGSIILTNSFGFGGQNAAMIFRRVI
jgi:3-oxoacyl-[acyl-carrier-protein] synthase II